MIELTKQTTIGKVPIVVKKNENPIEDKWLAKIYSDDKVVGEPEKSWIQDLEPLEEKEFYDSQLNLAMGCGEERVVHLATYVYVEEDYTFTTGFKAEDVGCVYLNDEWLGKIMGKDYYTTIPLELKAGWNKVEIIYWNNLGEDGVFFEEKFRFDENIKGIQYSLDIPKHEPTIYNTLETELDDVRIRPVFTAPNFVSEQLINSDIFDSTHDMDNGFFTMPKPKYGGVRFRMEHTHEYLPGETWLWHSSKISNRGYRAFLLKPHTNYTITYYVHEYENSIPFETGGYPSAFIWAGMDKRMAYSKVPGLHYLTITTDRTANTDMFCPFRVCYVGTNTEVIPEGARRVIDIELISMVEGNEPVTKPNPFFSYVGNDNGFSIYTQDHQVKLGEYELDGDIPNILNDIDDRIETKMSEFNISWI